MLCSSNLLEYFESIKKEELQKILNLANMKAVEVKSHPVSDFVSNHSSLKQTKSFTNLCNMSDYSIWFAKKLIKI